MISGNRGWGRPRETWSEFVNECGLSGVDPQDINAWRAHVGHRLVLPTNGVGHEQHTNLKMNMIMIYKRPESAISLELHFSFSSHESLHDGSIYVHKNSILISNIFLGTLHPENQSIDQYLSCVFAGVFPVVWVWPDWAERVVFCGWVLPKPTAE